MPGILEMGGDGEITGIRKTRQMENKEIINFRKNTWLYKKVAIFIDTTIKYLNSCNVNMMYYTA